jgi:hypothetical protein
MGWRDFFKGLGRVANVVVPVAVPGGVHIIAAKTAIEGAVSSHSVEDVAADLLIAAMQEGAQDPKVKGVALKIRAAMNLIYAADPDFH